MSLDSQRHGTSRIQRPTNKAEISEMLGILIELSRKGGDIKEFLPEVVGDVKENLIACGDVAMQIEDFDNALTAFIWAGVKKKLPNAVMQR